jgi:hypothetical protein
MEGKVEESIASTSRLEYPVRDVANQTSRLERCFPQTMLQSTTQFLAVSYPLWVKFSIRGLICSS